MYPIIHRTLMYIDAMSCMMEGPVSFDNRTWPSNNFVESWCMDVFKIKCLWLLLYEKCHIRTPTHSLLLPNLALCYYVRSGLFCVCRLGLWQTKNWNSSTFEHQLQGEQFGHHQDRMVCYREYMWEKGSVTDVVMFIEDVKQGMESLHQSLRV